MRVLVVGGAGYIGGSVTDLLLKQKIPFSVYDNLTYERDYLKKTDFIYGDIRDKKKLRKLLNNYSHVIWLAALVGDGACEIDTETSKEINTDSVAWLAKNHDGRIIFTSTCSVYGQNNGWLDEDSVVAPLSTYARTKLAAEKFLNKKNALIYRLGTAFGISDDFSRLRMDLAINYMSALAVNKGKLFVFGGDQWRPFIHVKDIARALVIALTNKNTGIYNLATDNSKINDIALMIKKNTKCKIEYTSQKFQDQRNYHVKTDKAKKAGLIPENPKSLIDGINEITAMVASQRIKNLDDEIYSNANYLKAFYEKNGKI